MEKKSAVSALQEYCAQAKTGNPVYEYIDGEDNGFICKVVVMDIESFGNGRSKRDAKHLAASNMMCKFKKISGVDRFGGTVSDNNVKIVDELTNMNRDMLKELRDYCVRHDMPMPVIEIIQQSGSPDAPEFVASCSVATIKRYGKSDKKKDARQRAAIEMLCIISKDIDDRRNELVPTKETGMNDLDISMEDLEAERRRKFKTYRELIEAGHENENDCSVKLCDRHNYFKSFYPQLKTAAFKAINSDHYLSSKDKLMDVLAALKLTPRITTIKSTTLEPVIQIEFNCEYDCLFIGKESSIYQKIIEYFSYMLV